MIETTIERWHQYLRGDLDGGLDELLHPDCVFLSPIVFTPQQGREVTKLYLQAAGATFTQGADEQPNGGDDQHGGERGAKVPGAFRYVKQVLAGNHDLRTWVGLAYAGEERLDKAADALIKAGELAPSSPEPPFALATVYARMQNIPAARQALRQALAIDATHAPSLGMLRQLSDP